MKKTLIALAVLTVSGASFAQSSVTISGTADVGMQSIDYKGTSVSGFNQNGSATSGFRLAGTEDLGGGLKANFVFGTDFNLVSRNANTGTANADASKATGGTFGNGELGAGLSGNFGKFDIGHLAFNGLTTFTTGQPFGTAIGGGYGSITRVNAAASLVRDDNAFRYVSPAFSGLTVSLYKSNKQTNAAGTNFSTSLGAYDKLGSEEIGANYANGPIAASFSSLKQDSTNVGEVAGSSTKVNTLGANYTMGAAKFFLLNQTVKNSNAATTDTTYTSVSAAYTMGATTVMAQAGTFKNNNTNLKSDLVGLGADYALSKRTALYARYESINDKANAVANPTTVIGTVGETTRTRTALGVRHTF
ncbi:porin [Limnohabitans sp.]